MYRVNWNNNNVSEKFKTLNEAKEEIRCQFEWDRRNNQNSAQYRIEKFDCELNEWLSLSRWI